MSSLLLSLHPSLTLSISIPPNLPLLLLAPHLLDQHLLLTFPFLCMSLPLALLLPFAEEPEAASANTLFGQNVEKLGENSWTGTCGQTQNPQTACKLGLAWLGLLLACPGLGGALGRRGVDKSVHT